MQRAEWHLSNDHMQAEEEEEVTELRSLRLAIGPTSELQGLGNIHSVCWGNATWPDNCYVAATLAASI
jgi:hypothetical protein